MNIDGRSNRRLLCWWFLPPALGQTWGGVRGKRGVTAVSSLSVIQDTWDCRYEQSSNYSDDMMGDPGFSQSHYHHLHSTVHDVCILREELCVFVYFSKQFSLGTDPVECDVPTVDACPRPLLKKEGCPLPACPQACQCCLKGEGPHNLLFVSLLLRKYFLNSSFSFVYFYCSYFLPWFNPVFSYLFAF